MADTFNNYVVQCRTETCSNFQKNIEIRAVGDNPHFLCGVCSTPITAIRKL